MPTPRSPEEEEALRAAKTRRNQKVFRFIGRYPRLIASIIVVIGGIIYIGIIAPATKDKTVKNVSSEASGQVMCTSDTAKLARGVAYEPSKSPVGMRLYVKAPVQDSHQEYEYAELGLYKTGDTAVDKSIDNGITNLQLVVCITQKDLGDSNQPCTVFHTGEATIHRTENTVQIITAKDHRVIATDTIPGAEPGSFDCDDESSGATLITNTSGVSTVYAPVDRAKLIDFLKPHIQ